MHQSDKIQVEKPFIWIAYNIIIIFFANWVCVVRCNLLRRGVMNRNIVYVLKVLNYHYFINFIALWRWEENSVKFILRSMSVNWRSFYKKWNNLWRRGKKWKFRSVSNIFYVDKAFRSISTYARNYLFKNLSVFALLPTCSFKNFSIHF